MNHSNVAIIDIEAAISPANISTVNEAYWTGQYYGYNIPTYLHKPIIMALGQIVILQDTPFCTEENRSWAIDYILKFWYSQPEAGITLLRIAKRYGLTSEAVNKLQRIANSRSPTEDIDSYIVWRRAIQAAAANAVLSVLKVGSISSANQGARVTVEVKRPAKSPAKRIKVASR